MSLATLAPNLRTYDNDRDEIIVTLDGREIRGWAYKNRAERRVKMLAAREFCEGWYQAVSHEKARIAQAPKIASELMVDASNATGDA